MYEDTCRSFGVLINAHASAGTGVQNDDLTMLSARIMVMAIIPFVIAQLSTIFHFNTTGDIPILVACVMAFALLLSYCLYQVLLPPPIIISEEAKFTIYFFSF